jgi:hypothetical protein
MHLRDANRDLKMDVANGVLGIRNMGDMVAKIFPLRDALASDPVADCEPIGCANG